jgi:hypothetical protein
MTARPRGPSYTNNGRTPTNAHSPYVYGRRGSGEEWEPLYLDVTPGERSRDPPRESIVDVVDHGQFPHRSRRESTASIFTPDYVRQARSQVMSGVEDIKARGAPSPSRMYKDEGRPPHLNTAPTPRDKNFLSLTDYQPPQFPQKPYPGSRPQSGTTESLDSSRRNRADSRTHSPIPPYASTPPPTHLRFETSSSDRTQAGGSRPKTPDNPYQLPSLKFSSPRKDSLLAGTPFDVMLSGSENESHPSPPPPLRPPPPPPPPRHAGHPISSPRVIDTPRSLQSHNEFEGPRSAFHRGQDDEWSLESVLEFLRHNGFGEGWQQRFRDADIHGDKFRSIVGIKEARKWHLPNDLEGKTVFKLLTLIRKALNPDSFDAPELDLTNPTPRIQEKPPQEKQHPRRQTAPNLKTKTSPESPNVPPLTLPAGVPRRKTEQQVPLVRHDPPQGKFPQRRARSPLDPMRPLSPNVDVRGPHISPSSYLGQYNNRHSKNMSNSSDQSDQSSWLTSQPPPPSQDFQEIVTRIQREAVVPQKKLDKKKSHEQMSRGGVWSRLWSRDKSGATSAEVVRSFRCVTDIRMIENRITVR